MYNTCTCCGKKMENKIHQMRKRLLTYIQDFTGSLDTKENLDIERLDKIVENSLEKTNDPYILKLRHTLKVESECYNLALNLELNKHDTDLVCAAGLLHDIGRFEQYKLYSTFRDIHSENHASLGIKVIKKMGFIDEFSPKARQILVNAIENHNKAEIDPNLSEKSKLITEILRDADKLDIYRVVSESYERPHEERGVVDLGLPDTDIVSDEVSNAVIEGRLVRHKDLHNVNDFKLMQIAWIFDFNFNYSVKEAAERGCIDSIFRVLPDIPRIKEIRNMVNAYVARTSKLNHAEV